MKNCGSIVHVDIATRDFMDFMKDQSKVSTAIEQLAFFLVHSNAANTYRCSVLQ